MYWRRGRDEPELVSFEPTKAKVANAIESLQVVGHLAQRVDQPAWLGEAGDRPPAREMVAMENGVLHLPTRTLFPHTPAFFSEHALPFAYEVDARPPERWLGFLAELWPDDEQSPLTLAEIIGYLLSGRTDLQKIFGLVGPKRAGKGVIARVISGLLGVHNTAAPTLSSLTTGFGLAPLVGKPLATISDARLGSRADNLIAVERLLSISGEDYITVDRKYRDAWTGKLPTRFLILTNEIPHFTDASGALASRFVLLTLTRSFYGHEDPLLTDRLLRRGPRDLQLGAPGARTIARTRLLRATHLGVGGTPPPGGPELPRGRVRPWRVRNRTRAENRKGRPLEGLEGMDRPGRWQARHKGGVHPRPHCRIPRGPAAKSRRRRRPPTSARRDPTP